MFDLDIKKCPLRSHLKCCHFMKSLNGENNSAALIGSADNAENAPPLCIYHKDVKQIKLYRVMWDKQDVGLGDYALFGS